MERHQNNFLCICLTSLANKYPCILLKEMIFVTSQSHNPPQNSVQGKHCSLCNKYIMSLLRLISVAVFKFTHHPVLPALLLILSVSVYGFFLTYFPLLIPNIYLFIFYCLRPLYMERPSLSLRQNPCLDSFKSNLKTCLFPKQYTCQVFLSVLLSFFAPIPCLLLQQQQEYGINQCLTCVNCLESIIILVCTGASLSLSRSLSRMQFVANKY